MGEHRHRQEGAPPKGDGYKRVQHGGGSRFWRWLWTVGVAGEVKDAYGKVYVVRADGIRRKGAERGANH